MNRSIAPLLLSIVALGIGCNAPPARVRTEPPTPPENVPLPVPVKPLGRVPTQSELNKLTDEQRVAAYNDYLKNNPGTEVPAGPAQIPSGRAVKVGKFAKVNGAVSGNVSIIRTGEELTVVFAQDFIAAPGPNLRVVVTKSTDPKSAQDIHGTDSMDVGPLQGTSGAQVFVINGMPAEDIRSVVVFSDPFQVVVARATNLVRP